jgi:hypothetical protein
MPAYVVFMSSVQEIEAALPKLSRAEMEQVRAWIDDLLEDQLEPTDEVKAKLDQSRRAIAEDRCTTRQPESDLPFRSKRDHGKIQPCSN